MGTGPMVHLTSVHHQFHARVIAARLGSDGILTELRGDLAGPYPVAGEVAVYVGAEDLPIARELLLADEVEACFEAPDAGWDGGDDRDDQPEGSTRPGSSVRWIAAVAVVLFVAMWFTRGL